MSYLSSFILEFFEQILTDVKDMCASSKNIGGGENLKDLCKTALSSATTVAEIISTIFLR